MCRIPHRVCPSGAREHKGAGARPSAVVVENARRKAFAVASRLEEGIVIGADTVVFLDGKIIGKLKTKEKVRSVLRDLSKKISFVYTGLVVIDVSRGMRAEGHVRTKIKMKKIADEDLDSWLARIGPYDRAGGFSIEGPGSILFPHIEGCYFNILGLPMAKLYDLFRAVGHNLLDFMK
jgi:septum formation protein